MRYKKLINDLSGLILMLILCVASLHLSFTGQLNLYIHPRYELFTTVMALLGLVFSIASLLTYEIRKKVSEKGWIYVSVVILSTFFIAFATRPQTLSAITASQRSINSGVAGGKQEKELLKERGDYRQFTVKDWATLLGESNEPELYQNKAVMVSGFVAPSGDGDVFYVSRFVVWCCAVDARPVGIAVYKPGWQSQLSADDWIEVSGEFIANPKGSKDDQTVIAPDFVRKINQPKDPYEY